MNAPAPASRPAAPWQLWVIGVLAFLWNCMGALDYTMTETRNASYLSTATPEQLAYYLAFPAWVVGCWAVSVWGGLLGSVLLLLRRVWAIPVFAASLAAFVPVCIYNFVLTDGARIMGGNSAYYFSAVIFAIAVGLLLYARKSARNGVLR